MTTATDVWNDSNALQLAAVLAAIGDTTTMRNFLRDVLTEKEIIEIGARLQAAHMLKNGKTYAEVIAQTKLSSRTVARISDWLQNGCNGYQAALDILKSHDGHTPPARA